ncbi:type I-E CRISPR-associated protein Cas6/Cse3/CasE [Geodermatophilus sp. DF01-2]|uniref:type I-E CRISPR-associated protein Cas6/Cse3/CasE n=1 Tax=Geodermatophilus sp. DF01-2 TaxID=2559610 RepID=UPI001ADDA7FD|nr:type I-E CRISPR-associated protein Cas6/Cse3/CasE [Geodermatophilus sp. DF01_2]
MTYLSRVRLNPARRSGRPLLGSPQVMHAAVMAAFPGRLADRTSERVLWRLDPADGEAVLYVVSPEQPDFTHLIEQAGWPTLPTWESRDYAPLLDRLAVGQRWAFRLTANPTRSRPLKEGAPSQRFGHVTVSQQQAWLVGRAEQAGFELPPVLGLDAQKRPENGLVVRNRSVDRFRRGEGTVTLSRAMFEGQLVVGDPAVLRATLTGGIGPAKAYGCGLLTLAPTAS